MKNINVYNARMSNGMEDKLFFQDKLKNVVDVYVDFGCADATLIKTLCRNYPEKVFIGFDSNKKMIKLANQNLFDNANGRWEERIDNAAITDDWDYLIEFLQTFKKNGSKICLILSSVLHEVENKKSFIKFLKLENFDYLVIRDMFFKGSITTNERQVYIDKLPKLISKYYGDSLMYDDEVLMQAMFKNYYLENLDITEMMENYFSFNEKHLNLFLNYTEEVLYEDYFVLPYWKNFLYKDFHFDFSKHDVTTHIKLILKLK